MPVKDNRFKTLCDNATEVHNHIKERIAKKERKRKLKKKTGQIPCKGYLQMLMTKLTDVSSYLGQIYQDPRDEFSTEDYLTFLSGLRDSLQFTFAQVDKLLEGSSKNFDSSELSAFITKLHHITEEMKLLFPQGALNQNVICVKPEVEKWWQENFSRRVIVPKDDFYKAFYAKHRRFQNDNEGVRETMAFTSELFVSKYQLDLFTRLFSPWEKSYNVHKALTEHPAYLKNATSSLATEKLLLLSNKPGSFYFRISINNPGTWAIGAIQKSGKISQVLCYGLPIIDTLHTQRNDLYIYPAGRNQPCDLSNDIEQKKPVFKKPDPNGNSLNCTLCGDNLINTQFDQCEHMCCHVCSRRILSQALSKKGPTCPFCQQAVLSTSFISLFIDEFYSDFNSKTSASPPARGPSQDQQFSPTVNHFTVNRKSSTPLTSPYGRRNKAEDRANKLRALANRTSKTENVLQAAISYLISQGYDEDSVIKALMESNGEREEAAKTLEGWKRQRNLNEQAVFGDDHCQNGHIEEIDQNRFAGLRSPNLRPSHLSSPDQRSPDLRSPNQRSPKIRLYSVVTPPEVCVDDQPQVHNGCHLDPSTRGSYAIPKPDERPKEANGVKLDSNFEGGYSLPNGGNAQPTSPNIRTNQDSLMNQGPQSPQRYTVHLDLSAGGAYVNGGPGPQTQVHNGVQMDASAQGANANSGPGFGKRMGQNLLLMNQGCGQRKTPDNALERASKLRALAAQTGKPENVLQGTIAYLLNQGYDEDSVFDALMEANGDRELAEDLCAAPDFPVPTCPRTPNTRPTTPAYGHRNIPNKAAERANKIHALVAKTSKSENVLQAAISYLISQGYDEDSVFDALMKTNGDRYMAEELCAAQRKISAPDFPLPVSPTTPNTRRIPVSPTTPNTRRMNQGYGERIGQNIPPMNQGYGERIGQNIPPLNQGYGERMGQSIPPVNQGYGERMGENIPPDKAAELANKCQALSLLTGRSVNDLQTAALDLVNSGYDEASVIAALMKSSGDRVEAAKILEGNSV